MSNTTTGLSRQISSAKDLQSVVRTMKAVAASSIGQYEKSIAALAEYFRAVELGLGVCLRGSPSELAKPEKSTKTREAAIGVVVFGSDQGLVGQFNDLVSEAAVKLLADLPGKPKIWAVGERVRGHLIDRGLASIGALEVPGSVQAIIPLVEQILLQGQSLLSQGDHGKFFLVYNRTGPQGGYAPISQALLPLDEKWRLERRSVPWPNPNLPEIIGGEATLKSLLSSYFFISIFRACAESLAAENASRLAAMQRAVKNIDERLEVLTRKFNRLRQSGIDEELFDVVSGFESIHRIDTAGGGV